MEAALGEAISNPTQHVAQVRQRRVAAQLIGSDYAGSALGGLFPYPGARQAAHDRGVKILVGGRPG
jgi:hypothetical protein